MQLLVLLQDLLTRHKAMVAGYLSRNYDQASQAANHLMQIKQCAAQYLLSVLTLTTSQPPRRHCPSIASPKLCIPFDIILLASMTPVIYVGHADTDILAATNAVLCIIYQSVEVFQLCHTEAVTQGAYSITPPLQAYCTFAATSFCIARKNRYSVVLASSCIA